ncbi:hypothetical protein B0H14DRAFT_2392951 [Mycena olivaceomarginata]|nr:hypothetical protein B0H14DRAFT_2392951 [Mycena olivaceomarginata]
MLSQAEIKQKSQDLAGERDLLDQLRVQIRRMDGEIRADEAALGDFKRSRTRALMGLKFGGLMECCEKGCAVADIGRVVVAEISEERTHPCRVRSMYTSHQRTAQRVVEAEHRVDAVGFAPLPPEGTQTPLAPPRQTHSWSVGATSMHSTAQRVVEAEHRVDAVGFAPLPPEGTQTPLAPPRQTHSWSVGAASMHSTRSSLNDTLGEEIGSDAADARRSMADSTSEMLDSAYAREIADQERSVSRIYRVLVEDRNIPLGFRFWTQS